MSSDKIVIENLIQASLNWRIADRRCLVKNKTTEERIDASGAEHLAKRRLRRATDEYDFLMTKQQSEVKL